MKSMNLGDSEWKEEERLKIKRLYRAKLVEMGVVKKKFIADE
jgi:hypothetical protein